MPNWWSDEVPSELPDRENGFEILANYVAQRADMELQREGLGASLGRSFDLGDMGLLTMRGHAQPGLPYPWDMSAMNYGVSGDFSANLGGGTELSAGGNYGRGGYWDANIGLTKRW